LPHFLQAIKPHIEEVWTEDMADAWTALFALIIHYMEEGLTNHDTHKRKHSKTFSVT